MVFPYVAAAGMVIDVVGKLASDRTEEGFNNLNSSAASEQAKTITLPATGQLAVPHGLGQVPQNGWALQCKLGAGDVWDYQAPDAQYVYLQTDSATDLTIKVVFS